MPAISIQTAIPGPRSRALMRQRHAAVPRGVSHAVPVFAASADGVRLTDVDGNVFLDFAGGIGVMNIGHSDRHVVEALKNQVERFTHTCFAVAPYESYVTLAERLAVITPECLKASHRSAVWERRGQLTPEVSERPAEQRHGDHHHEHDQRQEDR